MPFDGNEDNYRPERPDYVYTIRPIGCGYGRWTVSVLINGNWQDLFSVRSCNMIRASGLALGLLYDYFGDSYNGA